jgi:hypothetical protein
MSDDTGKSLSQLRADGPCQVIAVDSDHAYVVYIHWRREKAVLVRNKMRERYAGTGIRFHIAKREPERWKRYEAKLIEVGIVPPYPNIAEGET